MPLGREKQPKGESPQKVPHKLSKQETIDLSRSHSLSGTLLTEIIGGVGALLLFVLMGDSMFGIAFLFGVISLLILFISLTHHVYKVSKIVLGLFVILALLALHGYKQEIKKEVTSKTSLTQTAFVILNKKIGMLHAIGIQCTAELFLGDVYLRIQNPLFHYSYNGYTDEYVLQEEKEAAIDSVLYQIYKEYDKPVTVIVQPDGIHNYSDNVYVVTNSAIKQEVQKLKEVFSNL